MEPLGYRRTGGRREGDPVLRTSPVLLRPCPLQRIPLSTRCCPCVSTAVGRTEAAELALAFTSGVGHGTFPYFCCFWLFLRPVEP